MSFRDTLRASSLHVTHSPAWGTAGTAVVPVRGMKVSARTQQVSDSCADERERLTTRGLGTEIAARLWRVEVRNITQVVARAVLVLD